MGRPILPRAVLAYLAWLPLAGFSQATRDFQPVGLTRVQVGGPIGARIDLAVWKNFMAVDVDESFLRPFRERKAKEEAKTHQERFRGLGLQIHAAVQFAQYTGDPQVIARKQRLVSGTIATQSASGYIGMFKEEADASQLWHDWCFHEAAYIVYGLAEDYRAFGDRRSLDAAVQLAAYLMRAWPRRPAQPNFTTLGTAEAFLSLYDLTGAEQYLRFAADEPMGKKYRIVPAPLISWEQPIFPTRKRTAEELADPDPKHPRVDSCHMYRMLERAMMQLRLHRIEPRPNLPQMSRRLFEAMTRARRPGLLVTGGVGRREGWHEDQDGEGRVAETCASVYTMWLMDELARSDRDLRFGDVLERVLYNAFFAAQDLTGRRLRYFTPFSGRREYFQFDAFCCPNNFRRGIGSIPNFVYYQGSGGIAVNLYAASKANLVLADMPVEIRQETEYPADGRVNITVSPKSPRRFALRLRIPRWCSRATVSVNGAASRTITPGGPFHEIEREWRQGDSVQLDLPMPVRFLRGRELQQGRAALARGPVLYCLARRRNSLPADIVLRDIALDPTSIRGPFPDKGGITLLRVKGWSPGRDLKTAPDLDLVFSSFPDPDGEETYFRLSNTAAAVDDELISPER